MSRIVRLAIVTPPTLPPTQMPNEIAGLVVPASINDHIIRVARRAADADIAERAVGVDGVVQHVDTRREHDRRVRREPPRPMRVATSKALSAVQSGASRPVPAQWRCQPRTAIFRARNARLPDAFQQFLAVRA